MSLWQLFWTFYKIGTFTIGGGYAMIPLMEKEIVDKHHWIEKEEFMDILAVAQTMPGLFAANMATSIGLRLYGVIGAIVAVVANITMPILFILGLAIFFREFRDNHIVESIFMGVRPAVVALIAAPVFSLGKAAHISWKNIWIPILAAILICLMNVSPIWIILIAGLAGYIYGHYKRR